MKRYVFILVLILSFSCEKKETKKEVVPTAKLEVLTVNYPLFYFTQRIAGELINVTYLIPKNIDPAYWTPDTEALGAYQAADMIITNGANYAKWMEDVSLASRTIVNTTESSQADLISVKIGVSHSHGPEGEHQHSAMASTTWLDFKLGLKQAESIKNELIERLPDQAGELNKNFDRLKEDLESLDQKMTMAAQSLEGVNMLGSHPVYQYLSKAYNLNVQSVHFEPNEFPDHNGWHNLEHFIEKSKSNLMLWEDTPINETKAKLSAAKIQVAVFKPCGNMPDEGDFLTVMHENIDALSLAK